MFLSVIQLKIIFEIVVFFLEKTKFTSISLPMLQKYILICHSLFWVRVQIICSVWAMLNKQYHFSTITWWLQVKQQLKLFIITMFQCFRNKVSNHYYYAQFPASTQKLQSAMVWNGQALAETKNPLNKSVCRRQDRLNHFTR